jgi:hypothetical protein
MILPFDYIGYKRLSENKRFPKTIVGTATPPGEKWLNVLHYKKSENSMV